MSAKGHVHKNMFLHRSWLQHQLLEITNSTGVSTVCASHVELLNTTGDDREQWPCSSWSIQEEARQGSSSVRALISVDSTRRPATLVRLKFTAQINKSSAW